jgi:fused signal recognition particle receptor
LGNFLKDRLSKTRETIFGRIKNFLSSKIITDEEKRNIEEILVASDVSSSTASKLVSETLQIMKSESRKDFLETAKAIIVEMLSLKPLVSKPAEVRPLVLMVVGINGVGKTTTIGKVAGQWLKAGKTGMLAACDTFRAAGVEQLEILGHRVGVTVVKQKTGSDPASVAFDALKSAKAQGKDFLMLDTAGRLHTKHNLMEELKKIKRVVGKENPDYPQEIWLVLDATLGQNSLAQVREFHDALGLTGIVMTKMDGTAKGGMLLTIASDYSIPIKYIGIGEGMEDLILFNPEEFVEAIFS